MGADDLFYERGARPGHADDKDGALACRSRPRQSRKEWRAELLRDGGRLPFRRGDVEPDRGSVQGIGAREALESRVHLAAGVERLAQGEEQRALFGEAEPVHAPGLAHKLFEHGLRLRRPIVQGLLVDQIVVGRRVVGPQLDRAAVAARGLREPPLGVQCVGQVVERSRIVRTQLQGGAGAGSRLLDAFEPSVSGPQVDPGVSVRGR